LSSLCPHFETGCCSECPLTATPTLFEEAALFFAHHNLTLTLARGSPTHFRTRAKLAVRKEGIGLFKKGTHTVVETPHCAAHHPKINQTIFLFKEKFSDALFRPYNEITHKGDLRYIQCVVERSSQKVQLSLVINGNHRLEEWKVWCKQVLQTPLIHSLFLNVQSEKTNVIFSDEWHHVFGPECIWETIAGVEVPYGPSHFGQGNLEMFEQLLVDLRGQILEGAKVLETYAGVGVIGMAVAEKCSSVTISEREKSAERYFSMAHKKLPESVQKKLQFVTASSEESVALLKDAHTVIVDPPRKGLDPKFLSALMRSGAERIAYISCHFPSFQRDAAILLEHGYKPVFAKSYLFFPGTNHIELLAIFERGQ